MLSFSRVSNLPDDLPDWIRAEASVKRHAAAVREAAVLLEAAGVAVVPEKLRTLDHGRPWSDDQFASTRLSSSRDMSR